MQRGFTLVELSIVLIILALGAAGILAAQSAIEQFKLRAVITEQEEIRSAVNAFEQTYDYYPGDFPEAFSFWGVACATNATNCNGDGDGRVESGGNAATSEMYPVWTQLTEAGLYPGKYTGVGLGSSDANGDIGVNMPASQFSSNIGMLLIYDDGAYIATGYILKANFIVFAAERTTSPGLPTVPGFTADEASQVDLKIDDGAPLLGDVIGGDPEVAGEPVATDCDNGSGGYNLTVSGTVCNLSFRL